MKVNEGHTISETLFKMRKHKLPSERRHVDLMTLTASRTLTQWTSCLSLAL